MASHAKFSPSKLSRILSCPASGSCDTPQPTSSYAEEGSFLHHVTELGLQSHLRGQSWMVEIRKHNLTKDQLDAVEECLIYATNIIANMWECTSLVEAKVSITEDCYGTADLILYNDNEMHVIDWKFGAGVTVAATDNTQLMAYAIGACMSIERAYGDVKLHVVQPRMLNFDMHTMSVQDLKRWHVHTLLPGLHIAKAPDAPFVPSIDACRWCPRKATCTARVTQAFNNAETVFAEHAKLPEIDMDIFGQVLSMAEEIEAVIKDLKLHATNLLAHGKPVKGYKLVKGRSIRVWADEDLAIEYMTLHCDFEDLFKQKFVSPTQAEKLLGRELKKDEDFLALVYKPDGKATLVHESDKRAPLKLDAESVFASQTKE